ncbi:unnamed protein product, partial [Closterium sp. Naga37s-1]
MLSARRFCRMGFAEHDEDDVVAAAAADADDAAGGGAGGGGGNGEREGVEDGEEVEGKRRRRRSKTWQAVRSGAAGCFSVPLLEDGRGRATGGSDGNAGGGKEKKPWRHGKRSKEGGRSSKENGRGGGSKAEEEGGREGDGWLMRKGGGRFLLDSLKSPVVITRLTMMALLVIVTVVLCVSTWYAAGKMYSDSLDDIATQLRQKSLVRVHQQFLLYINRDRDVLLAFASVVENLLAQTNTSVVGLNYAQKQIAPLAWSFFQSSLPRLTLLGYFSHFGCLVSYSQTDPVTQSFSATPGGALSQVYTKNLTDITGRWYIQAVNTSTGSALPQSPPRNFTPVPIGSPTVYDSVASGPPGLLLWSFNAVQNLSGPLLLASVAVRGAEQRKAIGQDVGGDEWWDVGVGVGVKGVVGSAGGSGGGSGKGRGLGGVGGTTKVDATVQGGAALGNGDWDGNGDRDRDGVAGGDGDGEGDGLVAREVLSLPERHFHPHFHLHSQRPSHVFSAAAAATAAAAAAATAGSAGPGNLASASASAAAVTAAPTNAAARFQVTPHITGIVTLGSSTGTVNRYLGLSGTDNSVMYICSSEGFLVATSTNAATTAMSTPSGDPAAATTTAPASSGVSGGGSGNQSGSGQQQQGGVPPPLPAGFEGPGAGQAMPVLVNATQVSDAVIADAARYLEARFGLPALVAGNYSVGGVMVNGEECFVSTMALSFDNLNMVSEPRLDVACRYTQRVGGWGGGIGAGGGELLGGGCDGEWGGVL